MYNGHLKVCLFSFNRPRYLARLAQTLLVQEDPDYSVLQYQDGAINFKSGRQAASQGHIRGSLETVNRAFHTAAHIAFEQILSNRNYGIAIQQFHAYDNLYNEGVRWVVFLDDDVILSPYYLRICRLLIPFLEADDKAWSATPSFERYCDKSTYEENLHRVEKGNHPWIGYVADMSKWPTLRGEYLTYFNMVKDDDYQRRPHAKIHQWYADSGWTLKATSQDVGKACSLHNLGMHRYCCVVNRGFYIGEQGEHTGPDLYEREGWSDYQPWVHESDAVRAELVLEE